MDTTLVGATVVLASARVRQHLHGEEGASARERRSGHQSVMVEEVLTALQPRTGEVVVDATYGVGGHSKAIAKKASIELIALDADPRAGVTTENFGNLAHVLKGRKVNKVLFDLGWNRGQLSAGKGFSFLHNEPLLMTYGDEGASGFNARDILNQWSEKAIADALYGYSEERYAKAIARAVVARREIAPIETTTEFVEIIRDAVPPRYRHGKLHFATRSFQALRIAANDELGVLQKGLKAAWEHLECRGRIVVITFHSIEDRLVKHLFRDFAKKGGSLLYKKPLSPSEAEITTNPSARSAKLRAIEKTCTS